MGVYIPDHFRSKTPPFGSSIVIAVRFREPDPLPSVRAARQGGRVTRSVQQRGPLVLVREASLDRDLYLHVSPFFIFVVTDRCQFGLSPGPAPDVLDDLQELGSPGGTTFRTFRPRPSNQTFPVPVRANTHWLSLDTTRLEIQRSLNPVTVISPCVSG